MFASKKQKAEGKVLFLVKKNKPKGFRVEACLAVKLHRFH